MWGPVKGINKVYRNMVNIKERQCWLNEKSNFNFSTKHQSEKGLNCTWPKWRRIEIELDPQNE